MALPIEVLVVIIIAIIVLLGLVAVFFAGWTPYASSAGIDSIKNDACRILAYDCSKSPADIEITGVSDATNLQTLCEIYYDIDENDPNACRRLCGCI